MLHHLRIPALVLLSTLPIFSATAGAVSAPCAGNSGAVLTTYFGVPFYSNGTCTGTWEGAYQCPEVVKRYSLHPDWHGNAATYCDRDALRRRNLILVPNEPSAPALNGDIVAFDGPSCGKGVGHVGVRCGARDADHWSLCDENRTSRAANDPLELTRTGGALDSFGTSCLVCGSSRPGWDFSDVEGLGTGTHGWTLTDLRLASADAAAIRLDPGATAPQMLSPAGLRINPDPREGGYGRLRIFLRSSAGTRWLRVHFTTESDGAWDEEKAQFAAIPGNGGWNEVVVELARNPRWVGGDRIDQLRIDLLKTGYLARAGGVIEIDWMRFDR